MSEERGVVFEAEALARAVGHEEFKQIKNLILDMVQGAYEKAAHAKDELSMARCMGQVMFGNELLGRIGLADQNAKYLRERYEERQEREHRRRARHAAPPRAPEFTRDGVITS